MVFKKLLRLYVRSSNLLLLENLYDEVRKSYTCRRKTLQSCNCHPYIHSKSAPVRQPANRLLAEGVEILCNEEKKLENVVQLNKNNDGKDVKFNNDNLNDDTSTAQ